jgi:hypothetical protein
MTQDWNLPPAANDNLQGVPPPLRIPPPDAISPLAIPPAPLPLDVMHTLLDLQGELGAMVTYLWHSGHSGENWGSTRHCLDQRLRHVMAGLGSIVEPRRAVR